MTGGRSLKSFIPPLAKAVGMTPAALYERQRALVRAGLLQAESGRGPGSGVRTTAQSVAMLLIALLATDSLSETAERTKLFARLKCLPNAKTTFASALAALLTSNEEYGAVFVNRGWQTATIIYRSDPPAVAFGKPRAKHGIHVVAQIQGDTLRSIADELGEVL